MKNNLKNFLAFFIPIFFVNFLVLVLAWNPPTQSPPLDNVSEFLDTSNSTQLKEGVLSVGGVLEAEEIRLEPEDLPVPTCDEEFHGMIWLEKGETEEGDRLLHCLKTSSDEYEWNYLIGD